MQDLKNYYLNLKELESIGKYNSGFYQAAIENLVKRFLEFNTSEFDMNPSNISNNVCQVQNYEIIVKTLIKYKILIKDSCDNCDCTTNEDCKQKPQNTGQISDNQDIELKPQQVNA